MLTLFILSWLPTDRRGPDRHRKSSSGAKGSDQTSLLPVTSASASGTLEKADVKCPEFTGSVYGLAYPAVPVATFLFGVLYWAIFAKIYPRIVHRELHVERKTVVDLDLGLQLAEYITIEWASLQSPRIRDDF